jgi:hypothetical protein
MRMNRRIQTLMPTPNISKEIINAAIEGFESQKQRLDAQIAELRQMLNGGSAPSGEPDAASAPKLGRRTMSAAARKRIGEAQRKRWAATKPKAEKPSKTAKAPAPAKKRKLSAAGRAAIVAALKKRWAEKKRAAEK